jgi:hypothetical protein
MFAPRELAAFGAFFGFSVVFMSVVGLLTETVLPDRQSVAMVMIPAGVVVAWLAGAGLVRLKRAESPQTWPWYLRRELFALVVMVTLGGILAILPEEAREELEEAIEVVADNLQTLTTGLPP